MKTRRLLGAVHGVVQLLSWLESFLRARIQQLDDLDGLSTQLLALIVRLETFVAQFLIDDELIHRGAILQLAEPALHSRLFEGRLLNLFGSLVRVHQLLPSVDVFELFSTHIACSIVNCLDFAHQVS